MNPILQKKLSILIHLASVDGEFANIEKDFIFEICKNNGGSNQDCQILINNPDPIGTLGALSYPKVVEYMSECLSLMIIDGKIRPSEILLCEDIGLRLGFQKSSIDNVIAEISKDLSTSLEKILKLVGTLPHPNKV